jgi:hypothetical protein
MSYTGDKEMFCRKEGKKTKHTRCPNCQGQGHKQTTRCKWDCQGGYWCSNGLSDRYHR